MMKTKIRTKMKTKLAGALAIVSALFIGVTPMTAFAQVPECNCEVKCTEDEVNSDCPVCKEDITMCQGTEQEKETVVEENFGPLTPDGNLNLVDDYGSIEAGGKQFITVVTKTGNYFYIIIDRDDEGDETVHFLNMVDESDLLKLMDDEDAKAYVESIAGTTEESSEVTEEPTEEPTPEEVKEPEKGKKSPIGVMALVLIVTIGGIGGFLYMKSSKKTKSSTPGFDPDLDYSDEDDNIILDLDEDEDEFKDEEIEEDYDEEEAKEE